ncbi:hypothetical protein L3Q82_004024 [Scortum barcoo]|uniref:Uncharacterized protein n=1 Tax=Scortum barcoo TaxID=214431 RepID=A0ACB8X6G2_9TELE|nr:hypothetical protein L3Q82_004024 [Scortum barcoo]
MKDMTEKDKEKIRRYFQKRRESGGGDCGLIQMAGDNIYKICFKEKEDQERVLQKTRHTISLPRGERSLTVSRTNLPQSPEQQSTRKPQATPKANIKGLEKTFKPDCFLLYFLRDSPKANEVLQKQLSFVGCTVEFNFDEEEAVVRGDIEKGPGGACGGAAEKWEMQVDQVFITFTERYSCYHVIEPKELKILLQDLSFVTDDIRVYTEIGHAVVVGEDKAVKERIAILEKSLQTKREIPVVEKKFKLIEEEFSREMCAHCAEVKIHRGNSMITLEGPDKEVQSGATKLNELIKKVKEKRVKLCPALLTFITSSGAISKYEARFQQSLRHPVSLEVKLDLILSSLSSDALDEAEAAVLRDLSEANIQLQGATAVPPELERVKEIMIKAKNEENSREFRVDVNFILHSRGATMTKVQLVGYSENVNKLRELLHDYQMNQVGTQEMLNLPLPELVDCFDQILDLIGMKQTKVTIKASNFPHPCVLVSGPRCLVQEVQTDLNATLAGLTTDTLVLDGPGAQRYFQAEGKQSKELVESSCYVLIREKHSLNMRSSRPSSVITMPVATPPSIEINKTSLEIKLGSLVDEQALGNGLKRCLDLCVQKHFCSVAFPVIGPGIALKYPLSEAIQLLTEKIRQFGLSVSSGSLSTIHIVIKPDYPDSEECYHDVYRHLSVNMTQDGQAIFRSLDSDLDDVTMTVGGGVKVQLVFGDITNETTDAVVNTTDFTDFQSGGDILNRAGFQVEAELKAAKVKRGDVFVSQPGSFPCKAILHVCGEKDAGVIEQLVCSIIKQCEKSGFNSVAIPAICAGAGGLDPSVVAGAILRGVKAATSSTPLYCLTNIRLVLIKINVFLAFKEGAMQMFPTAAIKRVLVPQLTRVQQQLPSSMSADLSILCTSSTSQQSVFLVMGLSRKDVDDAMTKLKNQYQIQCSTQTFTKEELAGLTQDDLKDLKQLMETQGLYIQKDQPSQGSITVSGLKDGVNQVMQMINASLRGSLRRETRVREEEDLYACKTWCILGLNGNWERLPKKANYNLENKDIAGGIVDAQGSTWSVNLQRLEATKGNRITGQTVKLKRLVNLPDFTLPLYWDNMGDGEALKRVSLQPSSAEYRTVKEAFKRTVPKTVMQIINHLGATQLNELVKRLKERQVELPTVLMMFLKSSGAISKYQTHFLQNLRDPVSLEVGSNLVLSSFSSDALDEAEAAVLKDLSVASVQLQGASVVPPELERVKEIMIKAKNEENSREFRVDVNFISESRGVTVTEVQLVGYSENVNKLKEVLHDYQMNQVGTQEMLNLPLPELVDCFDQILDLIGMNQTRVTLKASNFPHPCVFVSGPRCLVQEVQTDLNATLAGLTTDTLVLDGPGAQRYFQEEGKVSKELVESSCHVLIREKQGVHSPDVRRSRLSSFITMLRGVVPGNVINNTSLEIKLGSLVDEQVNVLVVPMLNGQLSSTKIGTCLLGKAGNAIKSMFDLVAANSSLVPGDVLQVDAPPSLGCSKLFFIECLPWDGVRGQSIQTLGNSLKRCLDLCVQQHLDSVAFPIIGPGIVLKYPLDEAIQVLTEKIHQFGLSASSGSLSTIHIVIKPDYPDSEECYHDVYRNLSLNMNQDGQAIFKSLTSDLDDITMTLKGGIKLQLVFGDINNETTDAVVNTTDFTNFQRDGVCKDILTRAGPEQKRSEEVFLYPSLDRSPCKAILHVCGENDAGLVEQLVCSIIKQCEKSGFKSVAIPAICAGAGGLDPGVVADAILQGVKSAMPSALILRLSKIRHLSNIRLVLNKINVFLAFKQEAMQMFPTAVIKRVAVTQLPRVQQQLPSSVSADPSLLCTSSTSQQSVFLVMGLSRMDVDDAITKLKNQYQVQCSTQTFKKEELAGLTQDDLKDLKQLMETQGLYIQKDQPSQGSITVSGLKDGVNQVMQMINASLQSSLKREVRVREEEDLYARVAWCILGLNGNWERLPKKANHNLENKDIAGGIVDAEGSMWSVNLQRLEATSKETGQTAKLKRLVNLPDFTLPLYWDNMADGEVLKTVSLQPSSAEYWTVKEAFNKTACKTVIKIERLQNVHLRRAYEVQKKHISDKNRTGVGACEKFLYHGTTQDNCDSIMKTGFNRNFAGQNATLYGRGTYFAMNASYSANPTYSKPAADGSQLMFVARVLTGIYTQGQSNMKVPPPLSDLHPHDRYDSVVDRTDKPRIFVGKMDEYKHPLFFEVKHLADTEKAAIRRPFQKSLWDCGKIEKAGGNTSKSKHIKICFEKKEDKERVLQKKVHTISPGGELHLTGRRTSSWQSPDQPSTTESHIINQTAASKLGLIKKEKRVVLPTCLMTFIKSSRAISKYQTQFLLNFRDPVSLEVGSDLVLSSLSSQALDEAQATMVRDLDVANIQLQGAAAVPPELEIVKEIMIKAKNEENCGEFRVDVNFISESRGATVTKVQLVGYSENVNKLKELLHDYQMNQVGTQVTQVLNLPLPELVDCFDKILDLFGMKQTKVTIKASNFPHPCVFVSGPRCLVQEVQTDLNATLAGLTTDTLVLDGPGAQRYFQEEGKVNKELVESSCHVLIKEKQGVHSLNMGSSRPSSVITMSVATPPSIVINKTSLEIKLGSLVDEQVKVLVVPMLNKQLNSTKIGKCLLKRAGKAIKSMFDLVAANSSLVPGDVLQVDAPPSLGCSKLFFIECLPWDGVRGQSVQALGNGLKRCLDLCVQKHFCSVAFPVIGPGIALKYPLSEAIQVLTEKTSPVWYLTLNMNWGGQAIFRSVTSDIDDITMILRGGIKLQLVFGDITNETTDAVVNTTDFTNFQQDGVCKDILTRAGPEVEAELRAAKVKRGGVFVSQPGSFPCKAILHVCGEKDAGVIEDLVCSIIKQCEKSGFNSVAIPAICAVAVTQLPRVQQQLPSSVSADPSLLCTSSTSQQSVFLVMGLSRKDVDDAITKLKNQYQVQCSTQTFKKEELAGLTQDDPKDLKQLMETQGLYIQKNQPSQGSITVSGLKDGVIQVMQMINASLQRSLKRELRVREEEDLYARVAWCILGLNGNWERLPQKANHNLENKDIAGGIVDAQGSMWSVNLQRLEATNRITGQTVKLKRLVNLPDFTLPLYWDNMGDGEVLKKVSLQPSSAEYQTVKEAFKRTVRKTVIKIERLQNVHLRRAYEAQKKHISDKNRTGVGAGEKFLYHGTTQDNCDSIIKTGFNRRFAGQNATSYGRGTYFAVNASYSAHPTYSKLAADGSQLMFVARVLTGIYTQGQSDMTVPPPLSDQQPHDRYDSLVNRTDKPRMYVVFHDNQAYPDYLITFM